MGLIERSWTIRVCPHGHRVEWSERVERWRHMDANGFCDWGNGVAVEVVPAEQLEGAVEALRELMHAVVTGDGPAIDAALDRGSEVLGAGTTTSGGQ